MNVLMMVVMYCCVGLFLRDGDYTDVSEKDI